MLAQLLVGYVALNFMLALFLRFATTNPYAFAVFICAIRS
jgi:hypothetical protein